MFCLPSQKTFEAKEGQMRDLREGISAEAEKAGDFVRCFELQQGTRKAISRVEVGVKSRVDRLKAIGNGQVPAVVKLAWETLCCDHTVDVTGV